MCFGKNTHIQTHARKHEIHVHTHTQAHRVVTDTLKGTKHQHICTSKPKHRHTHTYSTSNTHTKTQTNTNIVITICMSTKRAQMTTHGLLRTYRGGMAQGGGEIGCAGAQEATGGNIRTRMVTENNRQQKSNTTNRDQKTPKHHQQHSKKYVTSD